MEIVENTLPVPVEEFLDRPLFAHLATASEDSAPRDTPVWFLFEDGAVWVIVNRENRTVDDRIERDPRVAVGIVDFDVHAGRVQHVGIRGRGEVVDHDAGRAERLLERYLGPDRSEWDPDRFGDPREWGEKMAQLRIDPGTVVARDQSYDPSLD